MSRKLDLAQVVTEGVKEPIALAPHDVVFVPKTPIANANVWVRQHLIDIMLFNSKAVSIYRLP